MCERCQNWKKPSYKEYITRLKNFDKDMKKRGIIYQCLKCGIEAVPTKKSRYVKKIVLFVFVLICITILTLHYFVLPEGISININIKNDIVKIITTIAYLPLFVGLSILLDTIVLRIIYKNTEYEFRPIQGLKIPENKSEDVDSIQN